MSQYDFSHGNRNFGNPISNVDWNIDDDRDDNLYGSTTTHTVSVTVQFLMILRFLLTYYRYLDPTLASASTLSCQMYANLPHHQLRVFWQQQRTKRLCATTKRIVRCTKLI
jgi:hypothetical protein